MPVADEQKGPDMPINAKHPLYTEFHEDWETMRDLYKGERIVKDKGTVYLPATGGMTLDGLKVGQPGYDAYIAYKIRAVFHDYVREGVEALIGLLFQKPPVIELPSAMEPMRERATSGGENLEILLRRINEQQLVTGRLGLLADLPKETAPGVVPLPYIALYVAESIINWDDASYNDGVDALNLVVLDETALKRDNEFNWVSQERYRVLQLGEMEANEQTGATYSQGLFEGTNYAQTGMIVPSFMGKTLDQIPFVFINSKDLVAAPDYPPLIGLGRLTLAIYRGEADYRQNLYMQGQDTLVTIGGVRDADALPGEDGAIRTGAGSRIDVEIGGDAKYIGVSGEGLEEQRLALENDKKRAETKAGQLINSSDEGGKESGVALRTRLAAKTATLNQIALTGAAGLEHALRVIAVWMGQDPLKVVVTPNVEFADFEIGGREFVDLMTARTMGAPISLESIHNLMLERGITDMDFEAEMALIGEEDAQMPRLKGTVPLDPTKPDPNKPLPKDPLDPDEDDA